jgi:hypothetical protein
MSISVSPAAFRPRPRTQRRESVRKAWIWAVIFLLAHIPLGFLLRQLPLLATVHAWICVATGLYFAARDRRLERVAFVGAYITGSEVLWRMTGSQFFWEGGKYAVAAIFLVALIRSSRSERLVLPIVFFILLLPSVMLTFIDLGMSEGRAQISFNLSGPLALMVSACFFANLPLSRETLLKILLFLISPIVAIAFIALFGIVTAVDLVFIDESNFATSGGFGPNQVSAVLGMGALLAFFYAIRERASLVMKCAMLVVVLALAAQSALTFSRGGLYNTAGALILGLPFLLKGKQSRVKVLLFVPVLLLIGAYFIIPQLNSLTGSALEERFKDTEATGRSELIEADIQIWLENPLLGVGPGQSKPLHERTFRAAATHTEFSRLVSEHGTFGLFAMGLLLFMAAQNFKNARSAEDKAMVVALIAWSFLFMMNGAMRLVAPAFLFGLSFAKLYLERPAPRLAKKAKNPQAPGFAHRDYLQAGIRTNE